MTVNRKSLSNHYHALSGAERFALVMDAMARNDDVEERRLEDSCPTVTCEVEDPAYRGRLRQSGMLALFVAFSLSEGLTRIRDAVALATAGEAFDPILARCMQTTFLYGRSFGQWEAGVENDIAVPALTPKETRFQIQSYLVALPTSPHVLGSRAGWWPLQS